MPQITNFAEAQDALRPYYNNAKTLYTLDVMHSLMDYLGNPQNTLKVLHVAGTSGKTSTAYYTTALLKESGKTVGLSVSPHVDTINERLQINGQPLPEAEFCNILSEFLELIEASGIKPSYFELFVGLVYWEFARRKLDYAVIEVGLGGLLDGTNIVDRADKVCLITDIGLDHTKILGDTLPKITAQKAGIIKQNNAVFMYKQSAEVDQVITNTADEQHANLHWLTAQNEMREYELLPAFQQRNLGLASAAVEYVLKRDTEQSLAKDAIGRATKIVIPARLEIFTIQGKTVIVDGSHNQQKLSALMTSIERLYPNQDIAVLCAFVDGHGERWQSALQALLPKVERAFFTGFHSELDLPKTAVNPQQLADFAKKQYKMLDYQAIADPEAALQSLLAQPEPVLLITGSFYLLNDVRPRIKGLV